MSNLVAQQQALLHALFAWPNEAAVQRLGALATGVGTHPRRGLLAYQANGHVLAERALKAAYPVVAQLLGEESFAHLARALWHAYPPACGDIAQWGAPLAEFIRHNPQLQDEPFLPDVAGVEWLLHRCETAADQGTELSTLVLLTTHDPNAVGLTLAPGVGSICSEWPVASIWLAHTQGALALVEAGEQIRNRVAQDAVVWRQGLRPQLRLAMPGECALLDALRSGSALEPALSLANCLDFSQWLPLAVQTGLVLAAYQLPTTTT